MNFNKLIAGAAVVAALGSTTPAFAIEVGGNEKWKEIGTGYLRDDVITGIYNLSYFWEFAVRIQESEDIPGRYRLVDAYRNAPQVSSEPFPEDVTNYLIVDASDPVHCYIELGGTSYWIGQVDGELQQMLIGSVADDYYNNKYGDWELADEEGYCGTLTDGYITFPMRSIFLQGFTGAEYLLDDSYYDFGGQLVNGSGKFRLRLPGVPQFDVAIDLNNYNEDTSEMVYNIGFADDMDYVLVGVFEGEYKESMKQDIIDGKVESVRLESPGRFITPYTGDGTHTVVAVPYGQERFWEASYDIREWSYSQEEWVNIGDAVYTEAIVGSNYLFQFNSMQDAYPCYTYSVKLQQNREQPWLIRLVDPYGPENHPLATNLNYDTTQTYYMIFDLGQHDYVRLTYTKSIGLDLNNGVFSFWSYADRALNDPSTPPEFIMQMFDGKIPCGHYDTSSNVVTFDENALLISSSYDPQSRWYFANQNGTARVELPAGVNIPENPDAAGVETVGSEENLPVRIFNLQGVEVSNTDAPGLYIVRQGDKSRKVMVK